MGSKICPKLVTFWFFLAKNPSIQSVKNANISKAKLKTDQPKDLQYINMKHTSGDKIILETVKKLAKFIEVFLNTRLYYAMRVSIRK